MTTGIEIAQRPDVRTLALGLLVGVSASALPLLITPRGEPRLLLLWVLALFVASCALGAFSPRNPWVWGASVGFGLPVVVVVRIVVDTIRISRGAVWPEVDEHTLFPFEILIASVIGLSVSLAGAYVGSLARRLVRSA